MRILYGVAGEGLGHAMRAQVVARHLLDHGHDVRLMAAGRAHGALAPHFDHVFAIHGLRFAFHGQRVDLVRSVVDNVASLGEGLRRNVTAWLELVGAVEVGAGPGRLRHAADESTSLAPPPTPEPFEPDVVLSDFESWTHLCGVMAQVPVVSIDNLQVLNRCHLPHGVRSGLRKEFEATRAFVKAKLPGAAHYVVTSFFPADPIKKRTTVVPPLLRPAIVEAVPTAGEHVLVYRSAPGEEDLRRLANRLPELEFRVYGALPGLEHERQEDNLRFLPLSEAGFVADLASCRAVIAGGGFTLMSEAVALGKPMLALPLARHVEQTVNARWLERLGYGLCADELRPREVKRLLERADDLTARLLRHRRPANVAALQVIDEVLAGVRR